MSVNWLNLMSAAVTGGIVVKFLDIVYSEYKRKCDRIETLNDAFLRDLDLILKSADELCGKLCSLAKADFKATEEWKDSNKPNADFLYVQFLFAQFWGRIAILRRESSYLRINQLSKGEALIGFVNTLESHKNCIVPRSIQRGVGEGVILRSENRFACMSYYEFTESYNSNNSSLKTLLEPLRTILFGLESKKKRQGVLLYGAILHAMIDNLDPNREVTKDRPAYPNKLDEKSRRVLKYKIFRLYLPNVVKQEKYWRITQKNEPLAQLKSRKTKPIERLHSE